MTREYPRLLPGVVLRSRSGQLSKSRQSSAPGHFRWATGCKHRPVPAQSDAPSPFEAPFDTELGLVYTDRGPDGVRAQLEVKPTLTQPMGIVHGGVWCSMVESMASVSAYLWMTASDLFPGGGNVVGVNNNTDFLRAVTEGTAYGVSEPIHRGRSQQLWLVTIRDDSDRLIARGQVRLQNLSR